MDQSQSRAGRGDMAGLTAKGSSKNWWKLALLKKFPWSPLQDHVSHQKHPCLYQTPALSFHGVPQMQQGDTKQEAADKLTWVMICTEAAEVQPKLCREQDLALCCELSVEAGQRRQHRQRGAEHSGSWMLLMRQHVTDPFLHNLIHQDYIVVLRARFSDRSWFQTRAVILQEGAGSPLPPWGRKYLIWVTIGAGTWVSLSWPWAHGFSYILHNWLNSRLVWSSFRAWKQRTNTIQWHSKQALMKKFVSS